MKWFRRRSCDDSGVSLAEVLVATTLTTLISALVIGAVSSAARTVRVDDDEAVGLADVKIAMERLSRDLRAARSVNGAADATAPSNTSQLTLWIDKNSDYRQSGSETITWKLQPAGDGVHFKIVRSAIGGTPKVQGKALIDGIAFFYDTGTAVASDAYTAGTRIVTVKLKYDAKVGQGTGSRKIDFQVRLRNVA